MGCGGRGCVSVGFVRECAEPNLFLGGGWAFWVKVGWFCKKVGGRDPRKSKKWVKEWKRARKNRKAWFKVWSWS